MKNLKTLKALCERAANLRDEMNAAEAAILDYIGDLNGEEFDVTTALINGELSGEEAYNELAENLEWPEGEGITPTLYVHEKNTIGGGIVRSVCGEKLLAFVADSDYGTYQAGVCYEKPDGCIIDLAMAEVKQGELAENEGLPADGTNKRVDLYVWGNPATEDYTERLELSLDSVQ